MNTKPALNGVDRDKLLWELSRRLVEQWSDMGLYRTCVNCGNWNSKEELCRIAVPPRRPPAKVIVVGCELHSDEIPF